MSMRVYGMFGGSQEFSVAYFGFDDEDTLQQFIKKYDNFVIEVDHKQKFVLQVSRAIYQTMPSMKDEPQASPEQSSIQATENDLE
jgi:hypothetical protein